MWLRDNAGWRREWLVGRLSPLTNYSVYAIKDGTRLSGPMYFTTKSGLCRVFLFQFDCVLTTGQRRSLVSSCTPCRIARGRHTLCHSPNRPTARPCIMHQIYRTHSRPRCLLTSRISPQACSPSPAVVITTRPCKRVQIARRLTAAGFVPSRYPAVASSHRNSNSSSHNNNHSRCPHSYHSRRARRRATLHWATPQAILRCYHVSRRATLQIARVPSFWAFAVRAGRRRLRRRAMALDLLITRRVM